MRPLALLTNDDGHLAAGLSALRRALSGAFDVVVCAPLVEQNATSHMLSLHRPLRLHPLGPGAFALDGTPADCVYVGLHAGTRLLPRRPDLVVSGLNHGPNLGSDVFYSGTVGGAREGALRGVPSLAASADVGASRDEAALLAARVAEGIVTASLRGLFNLNVPSGAGPWRLRPTTLGARRYPEHVTFLLDPRGREVLWIGGSPPHHGEAPGSDTEAFDRGEASLTPLSLDPSDPARAPGVVALVESLAS